MCVMSRFGQGGTQAGDANTRCACFPFDDPTRRGVLAAAPIIFGMALVPGAVMAQGENERARVGDTVVPIDGSCRDAIEPRDDPIGGPPTFVWPMEPVTRLVRNGSRLNKVLLLRLDPALLDGATR